MSKCTAQQALAAFEYWLGYYEKASSKYAAYRDKKYFETDKGANNYTYPGHLCGVQGGAWCAMMVSTAIYEACGESKAEAKAIMHGIWPYTACNQVYDAAPSGSKGRRGAFTPKPGDIIVFTNNGTSRDHTGIVYAVDSTYVYTMEGNSSNMCKKRSYLLTSTYIYGYIRPAYADATGEAATITPVIGELYGAKCCSDPELHTLSKGVAGPEVKTIQRILYARGFRDDNGNSINVDGDFGKNTKAAVLKMQKHLNLEADGIVGHDTWTAALTKLA